MWRIILTNERESFFLLKKNVVTYFFTYFAARFVD